MMVNRPVFVSPQERLVMDPQERDRLLSAWVAFWRAPEGSPDHDAVAWAFEAFYDVSNDSPQLCLDLAEEVLNYEIDDELLSVLAAGPVEEVLAVHGEAIIGAVEAKAASNPKFRHLLGGVWKNAMSDEVWARVCSARETVW
jgi:hypothetical protein